MGRLDGQVTLITGIAAGIGAAAATLFAQEGAHVFGVDRDAAGGATLAAQLQAQGHSVEFYAADLASAEACRTVVEQCCQRFGRIDVLYNNAGISIITAFQTTTEADLDRLIAINFKSVFYLCQQVLPLMQRQGGGVVINTASELAIVAQPLYAAYCATKGAVLSLTRALALEYAQDNIRINAVCPGPIDTPMMQQEFLAAADPQQCRQDAIATIPIGRLGQATEIAKVALFLATDAPALMHGSALVVDGGKTVI